MWYMVKVIVIMTKEMLEPVFVNPVIVNSEKSNSVDNYGNMVDLKMKHKAM